MNVKLGRLQIFFHPSIFRKVSRRLYLHRAQDKLLTHFYNLLQAHKMRPTTVFKYISYIEYMARSFFHSPHPQQKQIRFCLLKKKRGRFLMNPVRASGSGCHLEGMENEISFYLWALSLGGIYRPSERGIKG